jgi:O-antigen/teichoic acid export membrane protein
MRTSIQHRRVFINAIMSLVQIVLVSGVLFFLYKFLLKILGVEQFGIWSLILAVTSVTQVANLGLFGSVVKFVAKYVARNEDKNVSRVIQTAGISIGVIIGFVILAGYPLIKWLLGLVVPTSSLSLAMDILPLALFSLWLTAITGVFQSAIDGFQKIYIRNLLTIGGSIFYALLCFIFAPKYRLIGLAYAQIINNTAILIVSWVLIRRLLPVLPVFPYQWNKDIFKEIINYGINFQIITITGMFAEPTTKTLLSKFGGLSMVGYYEMANRMVLQFRALIVSANQVLVPTIAELQEKSPERIRSVYLTNYNLLFYLAFSFYTLIIISTPLISEIWIGHYERIFIVFAILLAIGWFLNTLSVASYFANLGTGNLRWNVIGHIIAAILNIILGFALGFLFNGYGVVFAWVVALSLGSAVFCVAYHVSNRIPLINLFPTDSRPMFVFCTIILLIFLLLQFGFYHIFSTIILNIAVSLFFSLPIFISFYFHPVRKQLSEWLKDLVLNKRVS